MHRPARRNLPPSLAALAILSALACAPEDPSGGGDTTPFPAGDGIEQNISLAALQRGGWSICHQDDYTAEGMAVATVLEGCAGRYLMLACTPESAGDLLALAAADLATVVTQPDAPTATAHHVANGVGWYFSDDYSWGFFPATEAVNRNPCDFDDGTQTLPGRRLCWPTSAGDLGAGYRCGATLNPGATWKRLVLAHP